MSNCCNPCSGAEPIIYYPPPYPIPPTPPPGDCACQALSLIPGNPYPHQGGSGMIQMILSQGCKTTVSTDSSWLHPVAPFATDMPDERAQFGITNVGDLTYIAGGYYNNGGGPAGASGDQLWSYHMLTNTWTVLATMPVTTRYSVLANDGTYLYLMGGYASNDSQTYHYRYNIGTNVWDTRAALPQKGAFGSAVRVGDFIYMAGMSPGPGVPGPILRDDIWRYQISTDTWITTLAKMPYPTFDAAQAIHKDGFIYIIGGFDLTDPGLATIVPHNRAARYNISTNTWSQTANIPGTAAKASSGIIANIIWVIGGWGPEFPVSQGTIYLFNTDTQSWTTTCCLLANARTDSGLSISSENGIYIFGGSTTNSALEAASDVEVLPQTTFIDFTVDANPGAQRNGNIFVSCYDTGVLVNRSVNIVQS